eukprot:7064643-Prymnesium_polylepis.1
MPTDVLAGGFTALRARVGEYMLKLPDTERTADVSDVIRVAPPAGSPMNHINPAVIRAGRDSDNTKVGDFLLLLWCPFTNGGLGDPSFEAFFNMLLPDAASAADPPAVRAVRATTRARATGPEPPFDVFIPHDGIQFELARRQHADASDRFWPLFET